MSKKVQDFASFLDSLKNSDYICNDAQGKLYVAGNILTFVKYRYDSGVSLVKIFSDLLFSEPLDWFKENLEYVVRDLLGEIRTIQDMDCDEAERRLRDYEKQSIKLKHSVDRVASLFKLEKNPRKKLRHHINEARLTVLEKMVQGFSPHRHEVEHVIRKQRMLQILCECIHDDDQTLMKSSNLDQYRQYFSFIVEEEDLETVRKKYSGVSGIEHLLEVCTFPALAEGRLGLERHSVKLVGDGISGTYLIPDRHGNPCGVFKPDDQVAGGSNNPKGYSSDSISSVVGISPEHFGVREEAAYLLDRGFASVPRTQKTTFQDIVFSEDLSCESSTGPYQVFVEDCCDLYRAFSRDNIPASEIQKMAIQDLRLLNADRHFGNVLVREGKTIIPIDHGLILPGDASRLVFGWMRMPQSKFALKEEAKAYIAQLDAERDARMLKDLGVASESIERMKIATLLLQIGIKEGLSLRDVGLLMLQGLEESSPVTYRKDPPASSSYFEKVLCQKIFQEGRDPHQLIKKIVKAYKQKFYTLSFDNSEWESEQIDEGVMLYSYKGQMPLLNRYDKIEEVPQRIKVLKVHTGDRSKYRFKVINTADLQEQGTSDPRMTLSEIAERTPGIVAAINGGYFHYANSPHYYHWDRKFHLGEPVGCVKSNGKRSITNPKKDLWGIFAIHADGSLRIAEESDDPIVEKSMKEALGCAPILIKDGQPMSMEQRIDEVARKVMGRFAAPGEFERHISKRHPRSAVALTKDAVLFVTVAGRDPLCAQGMTGSELIDFLYCYGAIDAMNLDGGGSSEMWVNNTDDFDPTNIVSDLSDGAERRIVSAIAVVKKDE